MKNLKLFLLFLLLTINTYSGAQTVDDLLSEANVLENTVTNSLNKANDILNEQQISFFSSLQFFSEYLIGQVQNEILGDLTRKLKKTEINLLQEIRIINNTIIREGNNIERLIQDLSLTLENSVARVPFAKKTPTPVFYSIPLITTSQEDFIEITIKGVKLDNPKNHLIFNGKKIPLSTNPSDRENIFFVQLKKDEIFVANNESNTFEVVLYKRRKEYRYKKRFYVVPEQIATVTFFYDIPRERTETSDWYYSTKSATSGSSKTKDKYKSVNLVNRAKDGWIMDRPSIKCWKRKGNGSKHEYRGPDRITDISFRMGATAKKGRAVCKCTWREKRNINYKTTEKHIVYVSFNDKNHAGSLPENSEFKYVEVKFTGNKEEDSFVTKQDNSGPIEFSLIDRNYTVKFKQ